MGHLAFSDFLQQLQLFISKLKKMGGKRPLVTCGHFLNWMTENLNVLAMHIAQ